MDIERFDNRSFTRAAHACWECPCPGKSTRCDARSSRLERVDENDAGLYVEPLEVGRFTLREALLAPNALQNGEGLSCPPIGRLLASRATIAPTRPQSPRWGVEYRTPSLIRCAKRWAPQAMRALRLMLTIQKQVCKADANRRSRCSNAIHRRSHPWDPRARKYSLGLTAPLRDFSDTSGWARVFKIPDVRRHAYRVHVVCLSLPLGAYMPGLSPRHCVRLRTPSSRRLIMHAEWAITIMDIWLRTSVWLNMLVPVQFSLQWFSNTHIQMWHRGNACCLEFRTDCVLCAIPEQSRRYVSGS